MQLIIIAILIMAKVKKVKMATKKYQRSNYERYRMNRKKSVMRLPVIHIKATGQEQKPAFPTMVNLISSYKKQ